MQNFTQNFARLSKLTIVKNVQDIVRLSASNNNHVYSLSSEKLKLDLNNHIGSAAFGYNKLKFSTKLLRPV